MALQLSTIGREWWKVQITTDPAVTGWDASFDEGETWVTGEAVEDVEDTWRWLVNGKDFDPTGYPAASSATIPYGGFRPLLRATDNPEVIVSRAPRIRQS